MDLWIQSLTIYVEKNKNFHPGVMLEWMAHIFVDVIEKLTNKNEKSEHGHILQFIKYISKNILT